MAVSEVAVVKPSPRRIVRLTRDTATNRPEHSALNGTTVEKHQLKAVTCPN
jgi:hypothetical protein